MQTARILGDTRVFVCLTVYFRKYLKTKRVKKVLKGTTVLESFKRSWKTCKVMEFKHFIFQAWEVMEFNCRSLEVMENEGSL